MQNNRLYSIQNKIVSIENAIKAIKIARLYNYKIVFTNGVFDILHKGHVAYLSEAASLGNKMIVAINSDASVKKLGKGNNRPINDEQARALVVAALQVVDWVIIFDDDTPYKLIEKLMPDVLVKGGDYDAMETDKTSKKYIVGSDIVKADGGKVVSIPLTEGFSTTGIIDKIKQ
jgi:rfaE bifunctional protein nucleotidyltransferase chain/domain